MLAGLTDANEGPMKKTEHNELRSHYDFRGGVRGKYAQRYAEGTNVVMIALDSDLAQHFPTSEAVNKALRELVEATEKSD